MSKAVPLFILLIGVFIGHLIFPSTDQRVEYRTVTVTHNVPGPEQKVYIVGNPPKACMKLVHISHEIYGAGQTYEETVADLQQILSDTRRAAVEKNVNLSIDIQDRLTKLEPKTISAAAILGGNQTAYFRAANKCQEAYHD